MNEHADQDKENIGSNNKQAEQTEIDGEIVLKESEYKKLVDDAASFKDKYVRILAEFDNARKRNERERMELIKYAHEEVIIETLGLYEDLERSLESSKKFSADANTIKGLELVVGKMRDLLKQYEVKPIESVGKKFDPSCHEAMMQMESEEHEDGIIVEEFQKGYWLGDRVVRTAKVKVAKNNK
jgi:molecular chaperone GrpE